MVIKYPLDSTPCTHCGGNPVLVYYKGDDLFYVQCSKCDKWSPYQFIGATRDLAIDSWEVLNRPMNIRGRKNNVF